MGVAFDGNARCIAVCAFSSTAFLSLSTVLASCWHLRGVQPVPLIWQRRLHLSGCSWVLLLIIIIHRHSFCWWLACPWWRRRLPYSVCLITMLSLHDVIYHNSIRVGSTQ